MFSAFLLHGNVLQYFLGQALYLLSNPVRMVTKQSYAPRNNPAMLNW
jgi:hypothetical protein